MMAIILREEDWGCAAAVPLGVLRGAEAAEEGRFSRCRSLLLSLWGRKGRGGGKEEGSMRRKGGRGERRYGEASGKENERGERVKVS